MKFELSSVTPDSFDEIQCLYHSNPEFLIHHLGDDTVDEKFLQGEFREMQAMGFDSKMIWLDKKLIGLTDYRQGEQVYLSLLLMDKKYQRRGLGQKVFRFLEQKFKHEGAKSIRIDVVYDYAGSSIEFWKKLDFETVEEITLCWGKKSLQAYKMEKKIGE